MTDHSEIAHHPVVSHAEWTKARLDLLAREKEFTRLQDELAGLRRRLPWERVEKQYEFAGPDGTESFGDIFAGRSQLAVYHFMFDPQWDAGCKSCSFWADNFNGISEHLAARDVTFVAVSRARYDQIAAYRRRMGWSFRWYSSNGSDFNFDYHVSFTPEEIAADRGYWNYAVRELPDSEGSAMSAFARDGGGAIYHTYSAYSRGIDVLNGAYHWLDRMPMGRNETAADGSYPAGGPNWWLRRHDEYEAAAPPPGG